jgi:hypothetical protein
VAGTGRGLSVRVMVSFDESRGARWPFEIVFEFVAALCSLVVVSKVGDPGDGRMADGAIVRAVGVRVRFETIAGLLGTDVGLKY